MDSITNNKLERVDNENKRKGISCLIAVITSLLLVMIDQMSKRFAVNTILPSETREIVVIKDIFRLTYLENKGAAWGMFPNMPVLFVIIGMVSVFCIAYCYWKLPFRKKYVPLRVVAVLLTAGAVGNMVDRILNGYVVDFFEFLFISFPVFNMADTYVTISAVLLLILIFFVYKEDDLAFFSSKRK